MSVIFISCLPLAPLLLYLCHYFITLGASGEQAGSRARQSYDALRENLAADGLATHLYARWLTALLDRVDWFFGDAGMADQTLLPHCVRTEDAGAALAAPAFDRCLWLALLYPIGTVIIIWAISGHAGPAGVGLGLSGDVSGWGGLAVAGPGFFVFAAWRTSRMLGWGRITWFILASAYSCAIALLFYARASFCRRKRYDLFQWHG